MAHDSQTQAPQGQQEQQQKPQGCAMGGLRHAAAARLLAWLTGSIFSQSTIVISTVLQGHSVRADGPNLSARKIALRRTVNCR